MRIRTLLATASLVVAGLVTGPATATPVASSTLPKIREAFTCGIAALDDGPTGLWVDVGAGHWTSASGAVTRPCRTENHAHWHPTLGAFTATVRWYAGTRVIKKQTRTVTNKYGASRWFKLTGDAITYGNTPSRFRYNGKLLKVTVTMTKKGYAPKVITRWEFYTAY